MPTKPGTSRKTQAAQTEVALKEAARRVFARSGYHGAKITDITTEAGRSAGSFYKHFAGKDDVLRALLADWLAQAGAELAADPAGDDLSQEPALRARVAAYWHTYRAHLPEIRALGEAAQVDPAFAESLAAMRHAGLPPCGGILSDCATPATPCPATPQYWHPPSTPCSRVSARYGSLAAGNRSAGRSATGKPSTH